tara:strand:+ start:777 stop:1568 length:792 start_codon:yes stop_codon:yes gene_type:complete
LHLSIYNIQVFLRKYLIMNDIDLEKARFDFYQKGYLIIPFYNSLYMKEFIDFLSKEVNKFFLGNLNNWVRTYDGSYDITFDNKFVELIKENNLDNLVCSLTNKDYFLADAKLRMWCPGKRYQRWHRDTYFENDIKLIGRTPPNINIFFYPRLNKESTVQLHLIERSQRRDFDNKVFDFIQSFFGKKVSITSSDENFIIFDSSILHGLPYRFLYFKPFKNKKMFSFKNSYPRLIFRFCTSHNLSNYNRGKNKNNINYPSIKYPF